MKNLKISQKLLLGFGTVLIMLLISSGVAFMNMNTIQNQVTNYAVYTVPNNNNVWSMRRDMISIQRYLMMALIDEDQNAINEFLDTATSEAARLRETLKTYLTTTRADQAKLDKLQANINEMGAYRQQIVDHLAKNTEQDRAQAYMIFEGEYKPILDENADILAEIGEFQNQMSLDQEAQAEKAFTLACILLLAVIVVAVIITILVTIIITKAILRPVKEVQSASRAISEGDLNAVVTYDGKDELGALAENMRNTTLTLKDIITDVDSLLGSMGDGDFTVSSQCEEKYTGQYHNILVATKRINENLSTTLLQINESSDQVSSGADQVSSGAQALSQGATEQASSVEELSAAITEISDQVKLNAQNAEIAKEQSQKAGNEVEDSNRQMQEMIVAMNDISAKSDEISKIIKTIEDIAFQTNILALNAAVEAARAGAAGKGFAVVADEVRNLAGKSAEAAKNTTKLIEETVHAVKNGTTIADNTAKAMLGVVDGTRGIMELIAQIASASNEQSTSISQVTVGVDQISSVVQTNSATAEESAAASEELSGQALMLKDLVSKFKLTRNTMMSSSSNYYKTDYSADTYGEQDSYTDFTSSKY